MIEAVLFDLDGTLLDIELDSFLRSYFSALGPVIAGIGDRVDQKAAIGAVLAGTEAMCLPHPGEMNRTVFNRQFTALTGVDLDAPDSVRVIETFYRETFPGLRGPHGPRVGGADAVRAARESGMTVVLATNPIFPLAAIAERVRWAGLDSASFDLITSYETSPACKPSPEYYLDIAARIGIEPSLCLMVGDDPLLDLPAVAAGMRTFLIADVESPGADWCGDLHDVRSLLLSTAPKG